MGKDYLDGPIMDRVVIVNQAEIKKHRALHGTVRVQSGMTWWELSLDDMWIRRAVLVNERLEMVPVRSIFTGRQVGTCAVKKADLESKENCLYDVAINAKNAKRKFLNRIKLLEHGT